MRRSSTDCWHTRLCPSRTVNLRTQWGNCTRRHPAEALECTRLWRCEASWRTQRRMGHRQSTNQTRGTNRRSDMACSHTRQCRLRNAPRSNLLHTHNCRTRLPHAMRPAPEAHTTRRWHTAPFRLRDRSPPLRRPRLPDTSWNRRMSRSGMGC